eukprot:1143847-Pelagomonas_calceolata.AAC.2
MEQLVRLKDSKIATLMGKLQVSARAEGTDRARVGATESHTRLTLGLLHSARTRGCSLDHLGPVSKGRLLMEVWSTVTPFGVALSLQGTESWRKVHFWLTETSTRLIKGLG